MTDFVHVFSRDVFRPFQPDMKLKKVILPSGQFYLNVYMFRNNMKLISLLF